MKAYYQLTLAQLKLFIRNKTIIFWTTLFPLFLMVVLGLFLGGGTSFSFSLAWVDEDRGLYAQEIRASFEELEAIQVIAFNDTQQALLALEEGNVSFVISIPQGFGEEIARGTDKPIFDVFYDEVNQSVAQLGFAVIEQAVDQINKKLVNYQEVIFFEKKGMQSLNLTYLDFLVPGIAALMILSSNMNGVAAQIASWRERGILRRMQSTGLSAATFISAQITARTVLNLSQAILVILIGIFLLGAQMNGSWLLLFFYLILGVLVFMAIGFIIASLAKSPEHAAPIAGFLSFPMIFLGGIFFPIANMPHFLQPVVYSLPIAHLSDVLREVMNVGATMSMLWLPTLILMAWFVGSFLIASWSFKWE
jgi:ABC-2 type transport system permease protein